MKLYLLEQHRIQLSRECHNLEREVEHLERKKFELEIHLTEETNKFNELTSKNNDVQFVFTKTQQKITELTTEITKLTNSNTTLNQENMKNEIMVSSSKSKALDAERDLKDLYRLSDYNLQIQFEKETIKRQTSTRWFSMKTSGCSGAFCGL